jgi:hypothetical protein
MKPVREGGAKEGKDDEGKARDAEAPAD